MKKFIFLLFFLVLLFSCTPKTPEEQITNQDNMYMVSHSEYWSNENGQIIARLIDYKGDAIVNANCTVNIFYPNKTYFKVNESMLFNVDSYYYNFITPTVEGVYEYKATCSWDNKVRSVMNSFHLSPALNLINVSYVSTTERLVNLTDLSKAQFGNITYNLTQIKEDTDYIRQNLVTNASMADFQNQVLGKLNSIANFCDDNLTWSSSLCIWVNDTRNRLIEMNTTMVDYLTNINLTVTAIYNNLTQSIYPAINSMEVKLDNILVNTSNIWDNLIILNSNVTQILNNLEDNKVTLLSINQSLTSEINENEARLITLQDNVTDILIRIRDNVEPQLLVIQNNITNMQGDITTIIGYTDTLEAGQQYILANITQLSSDINNLQLNYTIINDGLQSLNQSLQGRFDTIDGSLSTITTTIGYIENRLDCTYVSNVICDKLDSLTVTVGQINVTTQDINNYLMGTITDYLISINETITAGVDNIPPVISLSLSTKTINLYSGNNITVIYSITEANLVTGYLNVSYPNGSLMVQTTERQVTITDLNTVGSYNVIVYAKDIGGNIVTTNSSFNVVYGGVISNINTPISCRHNCTLFYTIIHPNSTDVTITNIEWTVNNNNFPLLVSNLPFNVTSSPGGNIHNITLDTITELGRGTYPGIKMKISIENGYGYSNYFMVDNTFNATEIAEAIWNYANGRYTNGEEISP